MKIREYIQVRYTGIIPDSAIDPNKLQVQVEVDDGQVVTLPTQNTISYYVNNNYTTTSALVYNYTVEWGDGTVNTGITTYNSPNRVHTYTTGGTYLIQISGVFPCWATDNDVALRGLITRVVSWGNTGLLKMNLMGCSALTRLPSQTNKLTSLLTFQNFCYGCSALTVIPDGTLFGCSTVSDFSFAFYQCAKLKTVPALLFKDCAAAYTFAYVFSQCTKLEAIPPTLFAYSPGVRSFNNAFSACTTLSAAPTGLFTYNPSVMCDFQYLFQGCSGLTTINPGIFYNTSGQGCNFSYAFSGTRSASIPDGLFDDIKISIANNIFSACFNLVSIPQYLFRYQNLCSTFYEAFANCIKLTGVPTGCFDLNVAGTNSCLSMGRAFYNSSGDVSVTTFTIGSNVFDQLNKCTDFAYTFGTCGKLEVIPSNLFDYCVAVTTFMGCFSYTKVAAIPSGLFSFCTEAVNFQQTFGTCTSLTSAGIPSNLFQNCTKAKYFGYTDYSGTSSYYTYGTFHNCTNVGFTYIPAGLFDSCVNAESFYGTFYGTKITSIPVDLLRYCTATVSVMYMFGNTNITYASNNVFQYNRSITTVHGVFSGCTSLTSVHEDVFNTYSNNPNAIVDFSSAFYNCTNVAFTSVPQNLFRYSVNAKKFNKAFQNANKLTSIPAGLFAYNTIAEDFTDCFSGVNLITSIPATLFTGLTQIKILTQCFAFCNALLSIPSTIFDSQGTSGSVNYTGCFRATSTTVGNLITGAVPELWLKPNSPVGNQCFLNRTAVSNYASIPTIWKT